MQKRSARLTKSWINLYLLITGIGIGWLLGLSVSPVVSIVLTSIMGAVAAIVAALNSLGNVAEQPDAINKNHLFQYRENINPLPLTMLVLGILIGSAVGIWARNHNWLGSEASSEVDQWVQTGLDGPGWTRTDIARKLFESHYRTITNTVSTVGSKDNANFGTFLFAVNTQECTRLLAATKLSEKIPGDTTLQGILASSPVENLAQLPILITDTKVLKNVVEQVLCGDVP